MNQRSNVPPSTSASASNATRHPVIHKHRCVPRRIGTRPNPPQPRRGISQVLSLMVVEDEKDLDDENQASRHRWHSLLTVRVQLLTGRSAVGLRRWVQSTMTHAGGFLQLARLAVAPPSGSAPHAAAASCSSSRTCSLYCRC